MLIHLLTSQNTIAFNSIVISPHPRIPFSQNNISGLVLEAILIGIFLLMGFYGFLRGFIHRKKRAFYIILGLFCFIIFIHTFVTGNTETLFSSFNPDIITKISYFSLYMLLPLFCLLNYFQKPNLFRLKFILFLTAVGIFFSLLVIIFPVNVLGYNQYFYYPFFSIVLAVFIIKYFYSKNIKLSVKIIMIFTNIILLTSVIFDFIGFLDFIKLIYLIPYGIGFYIMILSYMIVDNLFSETPKSKHLIKELRIIREEEQNLRSRKLELDETERMLIERKNQIRHKREAFLKNFTRRENEIIERLIQGDTYKDIAGKLFISEKTVNIHAQNIYKKAEVKSRNQLVRLFNIITDDEK